MTVPVLETPRLVLRAHRREDLADCIAMWSDPLVTRFTIGEPSTEQRTWLRMLGYLGHWEMMDYGYWAVEEKQSGRYVGEMGYADFKRGIELTRGIPELGWALVSSVHGKGYATEALTAIVAWGDEALGVPRTVCIIQPENLASIRVAGKLGYKEFAKSVKPGSSEQDLLLERACPQFP